MPYAESFNFLEIADHAHAVLGSIQLIQIVQPDAREAVTTESILDLSVHQLLKVLDSACDAGFRFEAVVNSTTGAWFLVPCICSAEAAIHSAWGDQLMEIAIVLSIFLVSCQISKRLGESLIT